MEMKLKSYRFDHMEFAGAFGDMGTLLPIFISLIAINGINPTSAFVTVGLFYIASGLYYNLPMPVQPLKAMSAIAIAKGLPASIISAAGISMGIIMLFLGLTGFIKHIARLFSRTIIRGIQFGVGLMLIKASFILIFRPMGAGVLSSFVIDNKFIIYLLSIIGGFLIMSLIFGNFFFKECDERDIQGYEEGKRSGKQKVGVGSILLRG